MLLVLGSTMADDEKQVAQERRILLVLGTLAFIVAVALIILALSSFHASSTPPTSKGKPAAHEMFRESKP